MVKIDKHLIFYPFCQQHINKTTKCAGVYMIKNILNSKTYIGSSSNIRRRLQTHINHLQKGRHANKHLLSAYNKYGQKSFVFCVLETCEPIKDTILFLEQKYLDLNPEYNNATIAENNAGWHHTKEACEKIRKANIGTCRSWNKDHKYASAKPLKKENYINYNRLKPVYQYTLDGKFIKKHLSASFAGRELNVIGTSINDVCRGKQNSAYGYKWSYKPLKDIDHGT